MKKLLFITWITAFFLVPGIGLALDLNIQTGFQTGAQYDWWESSGHARGGQVYTPIQIELRYQDVSVKCLSAYAYTFFDPSGGDRRSLAQLLDTKLNLSYGIIGKLPVDVLIGLDFNLPTGKTDLKTRDLALIMDPDLISINNFGEGFNINPTLTVAKEWKNWVAGISAGYAWRETYDFSESLRDFDPGNVFNLNTEVRYYFESDWNVRLFSNYASFQKERWIKLGFFNPQDSFQEGDFILLGAGLNYKKKQWDADLTLRNIYRMKSKFRTGTEGLATEERNSHGDEWNAGLTVRCFMNDKTTLKSQMQYLWIDKNRYPSSSDLFIGSRKKISMGLAISRVFSPHWEGEFGMKGFLMHDEEVRFPVPRGPRSYHGFSGGLQMTGRF